MAKLPTKLKTIQFKKPFSKESQEQLGKTPFKKLIYISLFFNFVTILFIIAAKNYLPPQVPLFYGLARGEGQLTTPGNLVLPSILSLSILFINILIASLLENDFLKKALIVAGSCVIILTTITSIKIVFLVGNF